jgi:hypothetical protein
MTIFGRKPKHKLRRGARTDTRQSGGHPMLTFRADDHTTGEIVRRANKRGVSKATIIRELIATSLLAND